MFRTRLAFLLIFFTVGIVAQQGDYGDYPDYQDYAMDDYGGVQDDYGVPQDTLYHDYAERQQAKDGLAPVAAAAGFGMGKALVLSAASWVLGGKVHARSATKKLKTKFQKEQKALYTQYYNDVYKLTEQNNQLQYTVEHLENALKDTKDKAELEAIQRDYEEFKQPDIDGDDRISRAEFNMYVKNYLSNYPGLQEKDYPKFEDFDHDGDGSVSFKEYAQQMALQVQQAEKDQYNQQQLGAGNQKKNLYKDTKKADSFQDIYGNYLK